MKKILCLTLAIFIFFCMVSCGSNNSKNDKDKYAILKLPNGEIVEGKCEGYTRWSGNFMEIRVDGTTYHISDMNVTVIESEETNED